jgi:hypothetical protein
MIQTHHENDVNALLIHHAAPPQNLLANTYCSRLARVWLEPRAAQRVKDVLPNAEFFPDGPLYRTESRLSALPKHSLFFRPPIPEGTVFS